jgi:Ca-activated chloride channel family protein
MHHDAHAVSYDAAIFMAQQGKWNDAHHALSSIVTDKPDNADVVYDAGVAAYNLQQYQQAATCFSRAAEYADNDDLRVRAYFNAGNASVDEKNLKEALAYYEKALAIDERNEYVRHNRDQVKKMLEEQQQQQQEQQQNDDQQQNEQDQDKQKNDQKDTKYEDHGDEQDQDQNQEQNEEQQNQQQGSDTQESKQDAANNQKRNGNDKLDERTNDAKDHAQEQQGKKHNASPENKQESDGTGSLSSEEQQEQGKDEGESQKVAINDPWLLNILNNQEQYDKAINKQLMEAKVRQHGGKNGQNCW